MSAVLEVRSLRKHFGGVKAIDGIDLDLFQSEILGIIGPNGAGKTALINTITGFIVPLRAQSVFVAPRSLTSRCIESAAWASPAPFRTSVCSDV